jgi:LemA protein
MNHEQETLNQLIETRNKVIDAKTKQELNNASEEVSQTLKNIFALAENYPVLKASTNFLQLQEEINHIEDDLSTRRETYNKTVLEFNNKYMMYPTKIFASILGFKQQEYFKISEEEKEIPEIKFD